MGFWRFRVALLHVAPLGWASEDEFISLVGHFVSGSSAEELLASFGAAYAFFQRGGRQRRRWVAASLIFLAHRDLSAPWCSEVSLFDALSKGWCGCRCRDTSSGIERNGKKRSVTNDRCRQEFDVATPLSGRKNTCQISSTIRTPAIVIAVTATDPTATRA